MDVREKLVDDVHSKLMGLLQRAPYIRCEDLHRQYAVNWLMNNGVTVQEWINSEEMLPEFPCLAINANRNPAFIPDGIITIKDNHGEWCINASLAKEVRLIDGTKIDTLIWENRIVYWMPLPQPPKGE